MVKWPQWSDITGQGVGRAPMLEAAGSGVTECGSLSVWSNGWRWCGDSLVRDDDTG